MLEGVIFAMCFFFFYLYCADTEFVCCGWVRGGYEKKDGILGSVFCISVRIRGRKGKGVFGAIFGFNAKHEILFFFQKVIS